MEWPSARPQALSNFALEGERKFWITLYVKISVYVPSGYVASFLQGGSGRGKWMRTLAKKFDCKSLSQWSEILPLHLPCLFHHLTRPNGPLALSVAARFHWFPIGFGYYFSIYFPKCFLSWGVRTFRPRKFNFFQAPYPGLVGQGEGGTCKNIAHPQRLKLELCTVDNFLACSTRSLWIGPDIFICVGTATTSPDLWEGGG